MLLGVENQVIHPIAKISREVILEMFVCMWLPTIKALRILLFQHVDIIWTLQIIGNVNGTTLFVKRMMFQYQAVSDVSLIREMRGQCSTAEGERFTLAIGFQM